jgi:peptide/nickel transport system substrate-binding protein
VGTGPYRLTSFVPKEAVKFSRNNSYWGITDHFETVHWDLVTKAPEPQLLAFKNNQVHSFGLRPNQWKAEVLDGHEKRFAPFDPTNLQAGRSSPFGWEIIGQNRWYGICWNTRRPQLNDKRVRQALAHAYDFERVKSEVFFDLAIRSTGPVHPNSDYANKQTESYVFNLQKAVALLDEAGWTDTDGDGWRDKIIDGKLERLSLDVTYYAQSRTWANLVSLYADTCKQIGVEVIGSPVEDQELVRRADNRDFDGFMVVWMSGLEVDFKQLWHSDGATEPQSSNYASYANKDADVGIEALRETFEPAKRFEIAAQVADQIYQDQPYLFVSVGQSVLVWHNTPYANGEDDRERLGGLEYGFENYHPLLRNQNARWHMSQD